MGIRPMVMYVTRSVYFDTYWKCPNQKQVKRIRVLLREAVDSGGHKVTPGGHGICLL